MSRNLLVVNVLLLALLVAAIWKIRANYLGHLAREQAAVHRITAPLPPPVLTLPAPLPPVSPAGYVDVAAQFLLSRDRNPNVVVEVVEQKPPPPLPRFFGVMDFGQGPRVILAERQGARQKSYLLGEKVGDFKLVAISPREIVFEWEGKRMAANPAELVDRSAPAEQPVPAAAAPAAQTSTTTVVSSGPTKPGVELTSTRRACPPGDNNPAGAIVDGYRKVTVDTPFGKSCWYEKTN